MKSLLAKTKLFPIFPKLFSERSAGIVLFTALIFLATPHPSRADYTWEGVPAGYGLAWSDNFNGTLGSAPNPANWTYDTGASGWGNAELENYTTSTANSQIVADPNAIGGKALAIIALDPGGNNDAVGSYTSARLVSSVGSSPNNNWQYGYMEARVKMPYGDGIWPAFWMLGNNINSGVSWPACGEIDIMENIANAADQPNNHGSLHDGVDWSSVFTLDGPQLFHNAYHTFAANWAANQIQFYVDGNLYETVNASSQPGGTTWQFNHSFFYLLNLAVGGNYPGNPDASTSFPQTMFVNYVRTYQSGNPTPTPVAQSTWRVHCGGDNYTDGNGNLWVADTNFTGGWPSYGSTTASGTVKPTSGDSSLYQYQRYGNMTGGETVTYTFNVPNGSYQVDLKFDETYWTGAGQRQFNYAINGVTEAANFDIYAVAGGSNKALDEIYNNITPNGNGQIVIQFAQGAFDNPTVGGIQIIPISPTATFTPTNTATKTITNTPTASPSKTPTQTPTHTPSLSPTHTPTRTATSTLTNTVTQTPTNSATKTVTATVTLSPTGTAPTSTPTNTPTNSPTHTATNTITNTPSSTPTNTPTPTATLTPTNASTKTPTHTPTNTATFTPTYTATNTPTITSTNSPTSTATNTLTPSVTAIQTPTVTMTPTYTATIESVGVISAPYPNPSTGLPVSFNVSVKDESTVTMDVFTLDFRKIASQTQEIYGNQIFHWDLKDISGTQTANGLYYIRVHVAGSQSATKILKVLILR